MKVPRGEIVDGLCKKVGIRQRVHQGSPYITKKELVQLNSFLDVINTRRKDEEGTLPD